MRYMRRTDEVTGNQDRSVCHYLNMIMSFWNQTPLMIGPASLETALLRQAHLVGVSLYIAKSYRAGNSRGSALVSTWKADSLLWAEERPTCFSY